jgi:hypothetical protein
VSNHRTALERLRDEAEREIATLDADLRALFEASRADNADDEHDPEGATIAYERAQLTAVLTAARQQLAAVNGPSRGSTPERTGSARSAAGPSRPSVSRSGPSRPPASPAPSVCPPDHTGHNRRPTGIERSHRFPTRQFTAGA